MKKVALLLVISLLVFGSLATAEGANNPKVVIAPINYKAVDQVVTLLNKTNEEVELTGFRIRDGAENVFRFSDKETETVNLSPFGVLRIHSGPGAKKNYDGKMDFYWTDKAIWDREKTAQLVNPQGEVVYKLDLSEVGEIDQLAGCLTRNKVVFYGMKTCSHCQAQKEKFGFAMEYINYIEYTENRERCSKAGISAYPTWGFGKQDKRKVGPRSLTELSKFAGCRYHE